LCKNSFSVANGGEYQVLQHQRGQKHAEVEQVGKSQQKFKVSAGLVQVNCSDTKRILSREEQMVHSEILFVLRSVQHDYSFRLSDDLVLVPVTVVHFFPQFGQPTNFRLNQLLMYGSHTSAINFNMF
jgi:hypothetical protein